MTTRYSTDDSILAVNYAEKMKVTENIDISKYKETYTITASFIYTKNFHTHELSSITSEDVLAYSMWFTYVFLGTYGFDYNPEYKEKCIANFVAKKGKPPTQEKLALIERNNLINFLRHRLNNVSVKIGNSDTCSYYKYILYKDKLAKSNKTENYTDINELDYHNLIKNKNYKKELKEKASRLGKVRVMTNFFYIDQPLNLDDSSKSNNYHLSSDFLSTENYKNGEDIDEMMLKELSKKFNSLTRKNKIIKLNHFIANNSKSERFKDQIKLAKKILKNVIKGTNDNTNTIIN